MISGCERKAYTGEKCAVGLSLMLESPAATEDVYAHAILYLKLEMMKHKELRHEGCYNIHKGTESKGSGECRGQSKTATTALAKGQKEEGSCECKGSYKKNTAKSIAIIMHVQHSHLQMG